MPRRNKKHRSKPIPVFETIEEEAEFWDSHSPLEYGDWEAVTEPIRFVPVRELTLYIEWKAFARLEALALAKAVEPKVMAREIIENHLANGPS